MDSNRQKWEHLWVRVKRDEGLLGREYVKDGVSGKTLSGDVNAYLAQLGEDGWELITSSTFPNYEVNLFFKRPSP